MNEEIKLILALNQISNLSNLLKENEYQIYIHQRLVQIKVELERQLTNLQTSPKIKK